MGRQKETQENTLHGGIGIFLLTTVTKAPSAVYLYMGLLGPNHPKSAWAKLDNRIYTAGQQAFIDNPDLVGLLELLGGLYQVSGYETMMKAYKAGKIRPELMDFLNNPPPFIPANITAMEGPSGAATFKNEVLEAAKAGKLDFSSFNLTGDKSPDWFAKYRLAPNPIPGILGSIKNLTVKIDGFHDKSGGLNGFKESIIETAEKTVKNALENGASPSAILAIAEEAKRYYEKHKKEGITASNNNIFRNKSEYEAGFVVDMETGTIQDLRGYAAELAELVEPGIEPLNEFSKLLKKAVKQYSKSAPANLFDNSFLKLFNATPVNDIINLNTTKSGRPLKPEKQRPGYMMMNLTSNEWIIEKGNTEVSLPVQKSEAGFLQPAFSTSTMKLIHVVCLKFTAQNSAKQQNNIFPEVRTNVREYLVATGRKITKNSIANTTRICKRDVDTMGKMSIAYKNKKYSLSRVNPFAETHIERGEMRFVLAPTFAEYLAKNTGFLMNYPAPLLKLKENNSNTYPLGFKLALNRSIDTNIKMGKANILSVLTCLESCPAIPSIEEVRSMGKRGGSPRQKIIEPFEKTLDALQEQGILERWDYCLAKGEILKDAAVMDYNYFSTLYINYEIKDFPIAEELPRIQATAEKRKKRKEHIEKLIDGNIAKARAAAIMEQENKK